MSELLPMKSFHFFVVRIWQRNLKVRLKLIYYWTYLLFLI